MQKIRVYDTRARDKAQIEIAAHEKDVNVLSWNALTTFMLASGADDNHMKVWDLRALDNHIASFNYHSKAITSIEWCPHESSMLATTSEVRCFVSCYLFICVSCDTGCSGLAIGLQPSGILQVLHSYRLRGIFVVVAQCVGFWL